jgi:hypothetical protein
VLLRVTMCPTPPDPTSLLRRAPVPPCVQQLQTPPPSRGGLRGRHVSCSSRPSLPARQASDAAVCIVALDPTSLLSAPALPHVQQLWTPPPYLGGLRHRHVSHNSLRAVGHKCKESCY